jgi:hypothetical protein
MPTRDGFNQGHPLPLLLADEPEEQGVEKAWGRAVISSPTKDGFNLLLLFLSDGPEQQGIGKAWDRAIISSRVLRASILVATATAISIGILSLGNPVMFFADITASMVDKSALQPGTDQSTPTIQSTADAQALPPTAENTPTGDEITAGSEPAGQIQTEKSEPPSEALLTKLPTWAAEKGAQARTVCSRCPGTGRGKCPSSSPAHAKAPRRPARP